MQATSTIAITKRRETPRVAPIFDRYRVHEEQRRLVAESLRLVEDRRGAEVRVDRRD